MTDGRTGRGRPAIGRPIAVRLPADVVAVLDAHAADRGETRAAVIREAVMAWTMRPRNIPDQDP